MDKMKLSAYLKAAPRGTKTELARAIGAHRVSVTQWANEDNPRPIPAHFWPAIVRFTGGSVTLEELGEGSRLLPLMRPVRVRKIA